MYVLKSNVNLVGWGRDKSPQPSCAHTLAKPVSMYAAGHTAQWIL